MYTRYLIGDATKPVGLGTKIIAHICNDKGGWGRGFVLALSDRWPINKNVSLDTISSDYSNPEYCYRKWYKDKKWRGRDFVLGQIQTIWVEDTTFVCNMIAQRDYQRLEEDGELLHLPNVNYSSLYECLSRLRIQSEKSIDKVSIHIPAGMGSGLGGGDRDKVMKIVNQVFAHTNIPVFAYDIAPIAGLSVSHYETLDTAGNPM